MTEVERLRAALAEIRILAADLIDNRTAEIAAIADAVLAPRQPTPDPRPALTPRQAEVLACIRESIAIRGYPPTVREIGARFEIASPNGVISTLRALRTKGHLRWVENKSRTLSVVEAT